MVTKQKIRQLMKTWGFDTVRSSKNAQTEHVPQGHFYSVILALSEIEARSAQVFSKNNSLHI